MLTNINDRQGKIVNKVLLQEYTGTFVQKYCKMFMQLNVKSLSQNRCQVLLAITKIAYPNSVIGFLRRNFRVRISWTETKMNGSEKGLEVKKMVLLSR